MRDEIRKFKSASLFSDGDDDCGDFSDETHCISKSNCSEDSFACSNGLCVPQEWFCGEFDSLVHEHAYDVFIGIIMIRLSELQMGRMTAEIIRMRPTAHERESSN